MQHRQRNTPIDIQNAGEDAQRSEAALARCLDRLEYLLDQETGLLRACSAIDFINLNQKKALLLLEFMRLSRTLPKHVSPGVGARLRAVNDRLSENSRLLGVHLSAMIEMSKIVIWSIQSEDSDGTYSTTPSGLRSR